MAAALTMAAGATLAGAQRPADAYLSWPLKQAEEQGRQGYRRGRVGGIFDTRILSTNRSYNYKLAATWFTPEVLRASAHDKEGRVSWPIPASMRVP